jgi:SSS family solute:Na+ symporter
MMPLLSGFLVLIALFFCFIGGQISIIVTDFIQGCLILVLFIVLGIVAYRVVQWDQVERCIASLPDPDTKVNPFKARDFGLAYMGIRAFQQFYLRGTSAAGVGRTQSAKSAEEARLMILISKIKFGMRVSLYFIPVAALAFMTLPEFAEKARAMTESLNIIENKQVRSELVVPLFLRQILPVGVMGMLTASFLSLSISTYNTYFLSWGGTLIQDVVNPIRNKPLDSKRHLYVLRWGVIVVALVVWFLAQIYKPTDYIYMFFAITGAIYMSGAGIVVIGALYWRRATTQAAWAAMITGALLAFSGILVRQLWPAFPLNGIEISFFTWLVCIFVFVVVSFLSPKPDFDLDQLLKRKT